MNAARQSCVHFSSMGSDPMESKPSSLSHEPWMIEDYLSQTYIQSWLANKVSSFSCFHTVVNIQKELKKSIRDQSTVFTHDHLKGFKPLIDFMVKLQAALGHGAA